MFIVTYCESLQVSLCAKMSEDEVIRQRLMVDEKPLRRIVKEIVNTAEGSDFIFVPCETPFKGCERM